MAIYPSEAQIQELLEGPDGPVVMLNLLTFKPRADVPDEGLTGQEAYARYAEQMIPFVESRGGRLLWSGRVDSFVIGGSDEVFHAVALVEYPSRKALVEIAMSDRVRDIGVHRAAGLESQWLIAATAGV